MNDKLKRATGLEGFDFGEALKPLDKTDSKELKESVLAKALESLEDAERNATNTRKRISKGVRKPRKHLPL